MTRANDGPLKQGVTQLPGADFDGQRAAILLAQANQRLTQEQKVFEQQLEHNRKVAQLQRRIGWVTAIMLPSIAIACIIIFFMYRTLPGAVVTAASVAFFTDVVGVMVAAYRGLMPTRSRADLSPTTRDPFEDKLPQSAGDDASRSRQPKYPTTSTSRDGA